MAVKLWITVEVPHTMQMSAKIEAILRELRLLICLVPYDNFCFAISRSLATGYARGSYSDGSDERLHAGNLSYNTTSEESISEEISAIFNTNNTLKRPPNFIMAPSGLGPPGSHHRSAGAVVPPAPPPLPPPPAYRMPPNHSNNMSYNNTYYARGKQPPPSIMSTLRKNR